MLSFLPHPQKPKGCGKRQDPTLLAFEWKPTNCSFWLCPLEHAIFWTGLDLREQRSAGAKTEAPGNPCSSHHRSLAEMRDWEREWTLVGVAAPPPPLGPHQLLQPFLLRSMKEASLTSWGLGKFTETTPLKKRTGLGLGSFLCQGCGWERQCLTEVFQFFFFFKHQRLRTSFSVEKACLRSVLPRPDLACINPEAWMRASWKASKFAVSVGIGVPTICGRRKSIPSPSNL